MTENKSKKTNLARKYRPAAFSDVAGQEVIVKILKNIISEGKVATTPFIFAGPRGVGKTSMARIYAKAINCLSPKDHEPCGECVNCAAISNGSATDIQELDGATNRGIDEVRSLKEQLKYMPSMLKYRIYIIDEAHQITPDAFNALLKILEEPPAHVVFIFASTEIQEFPITVRSRCLTFNFRLIGYPVIFSRLNEIVQREKIDIEEGALSLIAKGGLGSMRDSISLLEQVSNYQEAKIKIDDISRLLGFLSSQELNRISSFIVSGLAKDALLSVNALLKSGYDENQLMVELQNHFRLLAISKVSKEILPDEGLSDTEISALSSVSASVTEERLVRCLQIFTKNYDNMKWSSFPRIWLEISVYKASMDYFPAINLFSGIKQEPCVSVESDLTLDSIEDDSPKMDPIKKAPVTVSETPKDSAKEGVPVSGDETAVIIREMQKTFPSIAGYMTSVARPVVFDGTELKISFSSNYSKDGFDKKKDALRELFRKKFNKNIRITSSLESISSSPAPDDSKSVVSSQSTALDSAMEQSPDHAGSLDELVAKDGMIKKIIDDFGGDIVDGI